MEEKGKVVIAFDVDGTLRLRYRAANSPPGKRGFSVRPRHRLLQNRRFSYCQYDSLGRLASITCIRRPLFFAYPSLLPAASSEYGIFLVKGILQINA